MHKRIEITRADYEAFFGKADPDAIGACFYCGFSPQYPVLEYIFVESKELTLSQYDQDFLAGLRIKE